MNKIQKNITVFKIQLNTLNDSRKTAKNDSIKYEDIFYLKKWKLFTKLLILNQNKTFLTKKDAEKKIIEISKYFKNAFILKEEIDIEEIQN